MSTAEGGTANADAGVAPELRDWKILDARPTRCKGSAWESESGMPAEMVTQILEALDAVRPSPWEQTDFDGHCYFMEGCALCRRHTPCVKCVMEPFVEFRFRKIFV
jgi:hypothetical protein